MGDDETSSWEWLRGQAEGHGWYLQAFPMWNRARKANDWVVFVYEVRQRGSSGSPRLWRVQGDGPSLEGAACRVRDRLAAEAREPGAFVCWEWDDEYVLWPGTHRRG